LAFLDGYIFIKNTEKNKITSLAFHKKTCK